MKLISDALQLFFLANTVFSKADLITISLPNGTILNVLDGTNQNILFPTSVNCSALVGAWADAEGEIIGIPFQVGSSWSEIAPFGATQLLLGVSDYSNWSDNAGSWTMLLEPTSTNFVIQGTAQPWELTGSLGQSINSKFYLNLSVPANGGNTLGAGTAPTSVPITQGVTYSLSYVSGTVSRNSVDFGFFGPNGDPNNGQGGGVPPPNTYGWPGYWISPNFITPTTFYTSQYGAWERGPFTNNATFRPNSEDMDIAALIPESVVFPNTTTPFMQVINQGILNGALVNIQTLFWPQGSLPSAGFSMGLMQLTNGQIGSVERTGRSKITCKLYDLLYILNRPFPPHQIQSACRHSLFDAGCTLLVSNFLSGTITLDSSSTTLYLNAVLGSSIPSLPYALGYVIFLTGQNAGLKGSIKLQTTTSGGSPLVQFQLIKPMPFPVAGGDTIQLVPGCDKTTGTCENIYGNLIHFGGMPFVPNPTVAQ
jgi:hypothetical protein